LQQFIKRLTKLKTFSYRRYNSWRWRYSHKCPTKHQKYWNSIYITI